MMRPLLLLLLLLRAAAAEDPAVPELPRLAPLAPAEALKSFHPSPGFRVSAVAAEPQLVDPVSLGFDAEGALFVAEMRDYSERRAEKLSRIRKLRDLDGDGVFETSQVFMDGLAWATSVLCDRGNVYVAASPDLWRLRDSDGDGVADLKEVIFTGFGAGTTRLNVQALVNGLKVGPDGRIYGATAANGGLVRRPGAAEGAGVSLRGMDFSFDPESLDFRAEPGGGQFGLTFDDWGRRFVCSNSHHIQWIAPQRPGGWLPGPPQLVDIAEDGPAAPVFRLSPDEPWRVLRTNWRASGLVPGLVEGGGKSSGYFTSASGIHLWRGDAIIADCGSNLVHRKEFRETVNGPVAVRPAAEKSQEFLASTDTWFRPVSFTTGPDGALYIADMYREFIEHPDSLPTNLKSRMDLNSGNDRGRIWRVEVVSATLPEKTSPAKLLAEITGLESGRQAKWREWWTAAARTDGRAAETLLATLTSEEEAREFYAVCAPGRTEAERMTLAARLKIPPPGDLLDAATRELGTTGSADKERIQALRVLSRADNTQASLIKVAANPEEPEVVRLTILGLVPESADSLLENWSRLPGVLRLEVLNILGSSAGGTRKILGKVRAGIVGAGEIPLTLAAALRRNPDAGVRTLAEELLPSPPPDRSDEIARRQPVLTLAGNESRGAAIFLQRCATCHRDGESGAAVGPDREGFRNKGKPLLLLAILDPDREVAPQFARTTVTLKDGSVTAGISLSEDATAVRLRLPGGEERTLPRDSISRLERESASIMPVGIETGISDQDLADLLEFLTR